jgi:hypothetical protein
LLAGPARSGTQTRSACRKERERERLTLTSRFSPSDSRKNSHSPTNKTDCFADFNTTQWIVPSTRNTDTTTKQPAESPTKSDKPNTEPQIQKGADTKPLTPEKPAETQRKKERKKESTVHAPSNVTISMHFNGQTPNTREIKTHSKLNARASELQGCHIFLVAAGQLPGIRF